MIILSIRNTKTWPFLLLFLFAFTCLLDDRAFAASISEPELNDSDPVEFSSRIMDIDYVEGVLIVAESEVMIVDMVVSGKHFVTLLTGLFGEAITLEFLNAGQKVLVQGLRLADGRVVASLVQQLEYGPSSTTR